MPDVQSAPQAQPQQVRSIGEVAALNIAQALKLDQTAVKTVRRAIADEINAMSAHFTMAVADVQTQYESEVLKLKQTAEAEVARIRATWSFVKAHPIAIGVAALAFFLIGAGVGHIV